MTAGPPTGSSTGSPTGFNDKSLTSQKEGPSVRATPAKKAIVLRLLARSQDQKEKIFKLDKERIVLGSVVSADVRLTGDGISPIHAVLEVNRDLKTGTLHGTIFDLASDTGVFVNNKKVVTHLLMDQDEIVLGCHRLVFTLEEIQSGKDRTRKAGERTLFLSPDEDFSPLNLEEEREIIEIFDYRPSEKRALEVVMSWCGVILSVEHFVREKKVTVGSTMKSDFAIPSHLVSNPYAIVTQVGPRGRGGFVLNLTSQMNGVMQQGGELKSLDEIRKNSMMGSQGSEVAIGNDDFAKVSIGDIDFYFSYTAAPPRLKMRKIFDRDPFFQKIFLFSMILTAVALFSLSKVQLPQNVDSEQLPERIATILYQPEKFLTPPPIPTPHPKPKEIPQEVVQKETPPPKPKEVVKVNLTPKTPEHHRPIPKEMIVAKPTPKKAAPVKSKSASPTAKSSHVTRPAPQATAKEGEGARAKGLEGSRGEPNKKPSVNKVTALNRPSPHSGTSGAAGNSEVSEEGNVDLLKGASGRIQSILGNSAAKLGDGSQNLKGFGNFSTGGNGGLALAGNGHGGGGTAETTLGGLGKKGTGMGRVGTGKGAAGNGTGIVGSQIRMAIRTDGPEETVVMGSIDRNAIADAIYAHKDEFRLCYEREINAENPHLAGQISTSFVIGPSGRVTQAGVESSSLKNTNAERCVLTVLKRIDFPIPNGGGVVEVHFPFKFSSAGRS